MGKHEEKVINTRLGKRTISMDKVIYFPKGLIGFEKFHEFTLLQIKEDSPFLVLQSVEEANAGLLVADPYSFFADYDVKVGEAECKILRFQNIRQIAVLVTVSIPPGEPDKTSLNLTGPILVNFQARIGLQVPQIDSKHPARYYLHQDQE